MGHASGMGDALFPGLDNHRLSSVDVVLESTSEDLRYKRTVVSATERFRGPDTILISNSSSILPWKIDPGCVGMHFFYPIELHPLAEVILREGAPDSVSDRVFTFASQIGIEPLIETEQSAFIANRLLLPLQNEAFEAMQKGFPSDCVDECSVSELFPHPILTYMDHIGLDVVLTAVEGYVGRMAAAEQVSYVPLLDGLREAVAAGVLGHKVRKGIRGRDWDERKECTSSARNRLSEKMGAVVLNSVLRSTEEGRLDPCSFERIVDMVWSGTGTIDEVVRQSGHRIFERLQEEYRRNGVPYLKPARVFKSILPKGVS